jgi:hypothetical protein
MDYVGIDPHKTSSQVCILTADGELIERRIKTDRESFDKLLGERPSARILVEASTESGWCARHLEGLGHEVIVADGRLTSACSEHGRVSAANVLAQRARRRNSAARPRIQTCAGRQSNCLIESADREVKRTRCTMSVCLGEQLPGIKTLDTDRRFTERRT